MNLHHAALLCGALAAPALAQGPAVAIVAAATTSSTDCRFTDPQGLLLATGYFSAVDIVNASTMTPTLQVLMQYDAVLTWSNTGYNDAALLGDTLADYVDAGGGVVVATFANAAGGTLRLGGRWLPNYEVIVGGSGQTQNGGPYTLGNIVAPGHPLLAGVGTFSGGTASYRPTGTALTMGSSPIVEWSDGRVLVATGAQPNRVDLGFYPPPSTCRADFWDAATDGDLLMANALLYVAGAVAGNIGTTYCSPAVANSTGSPATVVATGSRAVLDDDVTLAAAALPLNSFGFFLTSQFQGLVPQPGGSQGTLCLGGAIGRYVGPGQIKNSGATGSFSLALSLTAMPTPTGLVSAAAGQTWSFQAWYRDAVGGSATSNFSDGVAVAFQ